MMILLIFLLFAGAFATFMYAFTTSQSKPVSLAARLQQKVDGQSSGVGLRDAEVMDKSLFNRLLLPIVNKLSKTFSGITPTALLDQCETAINQSGMHGKVTAVQLTTLSWILTGVMPVVTAVLLLPMLQKGSVSPMMYLGAILVGLMLGYRLPIGMLQSKAANRKKEIQKALPFTFDLVSISVQAGMSFDGAIAIVSERTKGPLSEELARTLREVNLGINRSEALMNLCKRTGVDDLRSFVAAVNYISKLGGSLVEVLKVQSEAMRVKRRQRAEEKANQAPVKMMIPLVLFILPCLFLVILGPAVVLMATTGFR